MPRVVILTPASGNNDHPELWRKVLQRLQDALAAVGIDAVGSPWVEHVDDARDLQQADGVLPLLAWGYHKEQARWLQACVEWARQGVPMANPPRVLSWNSDKRYLQQLATQDVAIPPTTFTDTVSMEVVDRVVAETGAGELIIKPAVSAGAWKTQRVQRGQPVEASEGVPMLLQPYLPAIETAGETSLLYFGGVFSHAVTKRPVSGEFRIQEEFGGIYELLATPPAGGAALAEQVLAAVGEPLLYARIDMVPDHDGRWLLMEAELIEPDFYLGADPAGGQRFAHALQDWLHTLS